MGEHHIPGNTEAEEQVLAAILSSPRLIVRVIDTLRPEHFATPPLGEIYDCVCALTRERRAPTTFNVADELVRRKMRSLDVKQVRWELEQLSMRFALDTRLEDYVQAITRASRSRRLIMALQIGIERAYLQEESAVEQVLEDVSAIALDSDLRGMSLFADALDRYVGDLDGRMKETAEGRSVGVRTGFKYIDRAVGELLPGSLSLLGARTSNGKTAWALAVALHIAKQAVTDGKHVGFFSLEMKERELVQRILSMDSFINSSLLRDGRLTPAEREAIGERAQMLRPIGLHIADNSYRLDTIKSQARLLCARYPIGLLIVDYMGLVDLPPEQRRYHQQKHEALSEISKGLKRMAQELDVAVLALTQLNRESEREDEPQVRHIGESDGPGRDADLVTLLHVSKEEVVKRNNAQDYFVDFLIRKQRNGRLGQERLLFRPSFTRFDDIASED